MKILFLGQPSEENYVNITPPLGLCYLSAVCKEAGFDSKMLDACSYSWKKIRKILQQEKPDVVGIQCITIERGQAYKLAKVVKEELPDAKILFGGQHATYFPKQMFKLAPVDFVVISEGELNTIALIKALKNKEDYEDIPGIAYKEEGGNVITNETGPFIENLDTIPFPDYSELDFKNYVFGGFDGPTIPIMTSRGCPYNCSFCSSTSYWGRYRSRSAGNILKELEKLYHERKIHNFVFIDDNFVVDKKKLIEVCKGIIEKDLKIKFLASSNVKVIDDERLEWLKRAGCFAIGFGVESGSDKILKAINKPQTSEDIRKAFALVRKYGITPAGSLIVGSPGETKETLKETAKLMNEIMPDNLAYGGMLWILPGTAIYELSKKQGIIADEDWLKTNKEFFYTAEYSVKELEKFQKLLLYYQAKDRNIKQKLLFLIWYIHLSVPPRIRTLVRKIYYHFIRSYIQI